MKNIKKLTSFLLVLVLCLSMVTAAFAESEGTLLWELNESGLLTISGSGVIAPFTSADDQPWAACREQITAVRFDTSAHMVIPNAAYWFSGCTELKSCVLPSFTDLGEDTFKDCGKLKTLQLYYHDEAFQIADSAFSGVDTAKLVITTKDDVTKDALAAKGLSSRSALLLMAAGGNCGINGCTCSSCSWGYEYEPKDASSHYIWESCNNCSANEYAYRHTGSHSFNSNGVCTLCGYARAASCSHSSTQTIWNGCDWERICRNCGETVDWGTTHGSYNYGAWTYYSATQHRRYGTCSDCGGAGKYDYGRHSTTSQYTKYSDTQHRVQQHCDICGSDIGSATLQAHSLSYGSWTSASDTQHRRTVGCSACGFSSTEYGNHTDANGDGKCDVCSFSMSATLTWDCGDGKLETTSQAYNAKLVLPTEPTKEGYTFTGWYTEKTGGSRVTSDTVFTETSPKTYYAQWEKIEVFRVTVPVSLPLVLDENGEVHTGSAEIINSSTGDVQVSSVTITAQNGWQLVPYATDMAHAKVDAMQVGFQLNSVITTKTGSSETFDLSNPWTVSEAGQLAVDYDAVVSAVSQPVTDETVLSVLFILEWAE